MKTLHAALAAAVLLGATPAMAAVCIEGPANETLTGWLNKRGEAAFMRFVIDTGTPGEGLPAIAAISPSGSISILFRSPDGKTCVLAIGQGIKPGSMESDKPSVDMPVPKKPGLSI